MAGTVGGIRMRKIPLSQVKDDLSRCLREAETEEIVITRHGKPAGILIGFESEEGWFDYGLENDPRFLRRIDAARSGIRQGRGVSIEQLDAHPEKVRPRRTAGRRSPARGGAGK
jgi:prevent-host-death family protein